MTRRLASTFVVALACLCGSAAVAQDLPAADPPAHISVVDGQAVLERDGRTEPSPGSMPLLAGDRLRTQAGRVEVLFGDGSTLHLDVHTVADFQSDDVLRLLEGRIRLAFLGPARDVSYRIDAPSAWVQIVERGEYRLSILRDGDVELAVLRGSAELVNEQGRTFIRAGERTFAREGSAPSQPYVYNSAAWDAFDRWSEGRRDQRLGVSAQYLPNDVRPYAAAFDTYGSWRHEPQYGQVWYPRVDAGWRPYHRGRWVSLRPYGWTWISAGDPWGWPTHHYGRWGISAGSWFWIPGRQWGPAWVSWAYATDYVSWCPLGWNNRPVLQIVNVNIYGGRRYSPWDAWTVVPRGHFRGTHVSVASAASVRIDRRVHSSFVVRNQAPEARFAVGRSAAPIGTAGRYAVPRTGSPGAATSRDGRAVAGTGTERRFPAPARPSRTPSGVASGASQPEGTGVERGLARERTATAGPRAAESGGVPAGAGAPREYQRRATPGVRQPQPDDARATTPAPAGAVRAVPRTRGADAPPAGSSPRYGSRTAPSSSAPAAAPSYRSVPSTRSSGDVDVYRAVPRSRTAPPPDSSSDPRGQAMPRQERPQVPGYRNDTAPRREAPSYRRAEPSQRSEPPAPVYDAPRPSGGSSRQAPSYRQAPESRGPSGPPPAAAPQPRSSAPSPARTDGGGRQRSGGESSGQGRRRGQ